MTSLHLVKKYLISLDLTMVGLARVYLKALYKYSEDQVQKMMDKWVDQFRKDFGEDTAYRFYENLIAATMTAGEIAVMMQVY
jgi:hypothetical protein